MPRILIHTDINNNVEQVEHLKSNFYGDVFTSLNLLIDYLQKLDNINNIQLYISGSVQLVCKALSNLQFQIIHVIKDFTPDHDSSPDDYNIICMGQVPMNVHNVGVYFPELFSSSMDYFSQIESEHKFQSLTESNKPGKAHRKGIYLSDVTSEGDDIYFNLLRCSTNLTGPTDNFRQTDRNIINKVNQVCESLYPNQSKLNHVLAQIYNNSTTFVNNKRNDTKARIKAHSDKTKDMPHNGLIAFCTFYKNYVNGQFIGDELKNIKRCTDTQYDHTYKKGGMSVLTRLKFKLKNCVKDPNLKKNFSVTLYPNSVFIIPLTTNRLYTHEIVPSCLPADKIPTRMGYVIRCSNVMGVHKNGQTYISYGNKYKPLKDATDDDINNLKSMYYKENVADDIVNYGELYFSMNSGDYKMPIT